MAAAEAAGRKSARVVDVARGWWTIVKKMGAAGCSRLEEERVVKEERKIGCWSEVVCSKVAEVGGEEGS
ncbi:hypothetical protein AMTR_s00098p00137770 [Amborella trichopoda]|uniref:Uncharacterized protein n=1 Tax=Amborella trichopoda TaxID=13333 RepID=W1NX37_AMBTC|nr:hypothetical protein AMTR_s00098p00137770 [Amborella trichopoda]